MSTAEATARGIPRWMVLAMPDDVAQIAALVDIEFHTPAIICGVCDEISGNEGPRSGRECRTASGRASELQGIAQTAMPTDQPGSEWSHSAARRLRGKEQAQDGTQRNQSPYNHLSR